MKKDLISLADLTPSQLEALIMQAVALKAELQHGGNEPVLAGKALAMVFQKPSLRTRVSFEMAMHQLGGDAMYLSPDEIGLGKRESVADVARVLSRYVDAIMARVFAHAHATELARFSRVPVINGLSDYSHPCQGLADLLTVHEKFGRLSGIRLAYVGDANNVLTSLLFGGAKLGMHLVSANPPWRLSLHRLGVVAIRGATAFFGSAIVELAELFDLGEPGRQPPKRIQHIQHRSAVSKVLAPF